MTDEMTPELYARVKAIYMDALDLTSRERRALLDRRCAGDDALRAAVLGLLGQTDDRPLIDDAPPADDPLRVRGAELEGGFVVGVCAAEGGFSHVYRGTDPEGRSVALKVLKPGPAGTDAASLRAAFEQEASILDRLRGEPDAAVVASHGLVELTTARGDRRPTLVMEWLDGHVLSALLGGDRRRWPLAEVRALLTPIARTLGLAHRAGVAHRDIKPDNIFVVMPDDGGAGRSTSKLFDFGVAKVAALHTRGFDSTGRALSAFTVRYAAPEQVSTRWGTTGPWTDVYALALVCAEMLGGQRCMEGPPAAIMAATLDETRRPVPDGLEPTVADALRRALSVDPRQRPPDADAFWASLDPAPAPKRRWWPFGR